MAPGTGRALVLGSCLLVGPEPGAGWPDCVAVAGDCPALAGAVAPGVVVGCDVLG